MNRQEAISYNVMKLEEYLEVTLSGAHWDTGRMPCPHNATTRVFGIVDSRTLKLEELFSKNPPEPRDQYTLTEIIVLGRKRKTRFSKLIQTIKNRGRKTHKIIDWEEYTMFGKRSKLPSEAQEILKASRDAYNECYGFRA